MKIKEAESEWADLTEYWMERTQYLRDKYAKQGRNDEARLLDDVLWRVAQLEV